MRVHHLRIAMVGLAAVLACLTSLVMTETALASPVVSTIVSGLNSPRHLSFGPGGHLYVAVAGVGDDAHPLCTTGVGTLGTPTRFCGSASSGVDEITRAGTTVPVLKLLPSVQEADTGNVSGVDAITFQGQNPVVLMNNVQSNAIGDSALNGAITAPNGYLQGAVPEEKQNGAIEHLQEGANISGFAATHPQPPTTLGGVPGTTLYASDPSDVVPYRGAYAVTDAGANDLLDATLPAHGTGRVSLLARFPTTPETAPAGVLGPGPVSIDAQAQPSSVTVGPDGALYVGVQRGTPGLPGSAEVYRVIPGQPPVAVVTGLTDVSDLAFTKAGQLLILESNTGGALAPPSTHGALLVATLNGTTPVTATDLQVPGLIDPAGLTIGPNGDAYISNNTTGAHRGQIIRVSQLG